MMKIKSYVIALLLLFCVPAFGMTLLVKAEVQRIDTDKKMVVLEGNRIFKLDIDIKKSEYNNDFDRNKEVSFRQLKVGKVYYFNLYANPKLSKDTFNEIVFIADSEPGE